jgi:hypothetical protein
MSDVAQIHSTSEPEDSDAGSEAPRQRFELEETGFKEVPKRWRKFYRHWKGEGDSLAPNEVICPVCKVVIRSNREFRPGDRVYCMPCMSRMVVVRCDDGSLKAEVTY